ncbi:MAG: peptidoglycan-binding protein [Rhodobacteraceae bacterium]|nr:peptidoglycan-binding protein [Paracoccaceae bacterium]
MRQPRLKWIILTALALGITSPEPVFAQRQGGFLSGLFRNNQNNRNQQAAYSAQRNANRAVQSALNFFAFNVGVVDGIFGRKSRAAINDFQAFMGYEATGTLTHEERDFLMSSFNKLSNENEALALKISLGLVSAQDALRALSENGAIVAEAEELAAPQGPLSMRALCVNIGADTPFEHVKAQFCNLRQLAVEQSNFLLETSLSTSEIGPIIEGCQSFTAELRPQLLQLATTDSTELISEMDLWLRRAGASTEKLTRQAETCLGVAYQHDDSEAALAALLVLSGLKNPIYIEQTGYHLALGLGLEGTRELARARGWMEAAIAAQTGDIMSLTSQTSQQRTEVLVDIITLLSAPE